MAETKKAAPKTSNGRGKGVAFAKWAKIDRAQRNMLVAVSLASVVLGVTAVGVIYLSKVIAFNAKVIGEKGKVIEDYKKIQNNLQVISDRVNELRDDSALEVVARTRSADCAGLAINKLGATSSVEDIELTRTCTALRVIPDALPSQMNDEATLASLNWLLLWSDSQLKIDGISGTEVEGVALVDRDGGTSASSLQPTGAAISINDGSAKVHKALDTIENSIRNYDIASATITWSGGTVNERNTYIPETIELNATYRAYYSNAKKIEKKTKKICADDTSAKCTGRRKK